MLFLLPFVSGLCRSIACIIANHRSFLLPHPPCSEVGLFLTVITQSVKTFPLIVWQFLLVAAAGIVPTYRVAMNTFLPCLSCLRPYPLTVYKAQVPKIINIGEEFNIINIIIIFLCWVFLTMTSRKNNPLIFHLLSCPKLPRWPLNTISNKMSHKHWLDQYSDLLFVFNIFCLITVVHNYAVS